MLFIGFPCLCVYLCFVFLEKITNWRWNRILLRESTASPSSLQGECQIYAWPAYDQNILCLVCCNNITCLFICISFQTVFDDLEGEEMRRARTRSNPYETIRGAFFLNRWVMSPHVCSVITEACFSKFLSLCFVLRAAMKMANMDHVFDYMFTNPKDSHGVRPQLHKL